MYPSHSGLFRPIPAYSGSFRLIPAYSVPFRLIPSHSGLFRPARTLRRPVVGGRFAPAAGGAGEGVAREQGLERGRAEERALPCRQAGRKFDAETAERLSGLPERLSHPERLAEVGDRIIECRTGTELLDHAGRISRLS